MNKMYDEFDLCLGKMIDEFWSSVNRQGNNECWEWDGKTDSEGRCILDTGFHDSVSNEEITVMAQRVSYFLANGPIDPGIPIMHMNHNRRCVNPNHLFEYW